MTLSIPDSDLAPYKKPDFLTKQGDESRRGCDLGMRMGILVVRAASDYRAPTDRPYK